MKYKIESVKINKRSHLTLSIIDNQLTLKTKKDLVIYFEEFKPDDDLQIELWGLVVHELLIEIDYPLKLCFIQCEIYNLYFSDIVVIKSIIIISSHIGHIKQSSDVWKVIEHIAISLSHISNIKHLHIKSMNIEYCTIHHWNCYVENMKVKESKIIHHHTYMKYVKVVGELVIRKAYHNQPTKLLYPINMITYLLT